MVLSSLVPSLFIVYGTSSHHLLVIFSGGVTLLAVAGVPPTQIQALDRWSSETWQRYI